MAGGHLGARGGHAQEVCPRGLAAEPRRRAQRRQRTQGKVTGPVEARLWVSLAWLPCSVVWQAAQQGGEAQRPGPSWCLVDAALCRASARLLAGIPAW